MSTLPISTNQDAIDRVLLSVTELAVLPQVVHKVVDVSGSDETAAKMIEKVIEVDPGFSARVLACSNSAYYGLPRKVASIREAVMFLGIKAVRHLAMTVGVFDLFVGKTDAESLRRRAWWRTSLETAQIAKWLAEKSWSCRPDDAYTAGLLHLIGKTLLDRFDPTLYEQVSALVSEGASQLDAETLIYGCNHIEVGAAGALLWGFPPILVDAFDTTEPSEGNPLRECVALARAISDALAADDKGARLPRWAIERLGLAETPINDFLVQGRTLTEKSAQLAM